MKSIHCYLLAFSFIFPLILGGCMEENDPIPDPDFLKCRIDNVAFEATLSLTGELNNGTIIVNGVNSSNDTLRMLIEDHTPGSWPIKNIHNICILKSGGVTYLPLNSDDGQMIILVNDTVKRRLEGAFFYTADDGSGTRKYITQGYFKTVYQ